MAAAQKLSTEECVKLLDPEVHQAIRASLLRYKAKGLLVFSNHDLSCLDIGHKFAIGWGPENTLTEPPADGKCQVKPPRGHGWQYYLDAYSSDLENGVPKA